MLKRYDYGDGSGGFMPVGFALHAWSEEEVELDPERCRDVFIASEDVACDIFGNPLDGDCRGDFCAGFCEEDWMHGRLTEDKEAEAEAEKPFLSGDGWKCFAKIPLSFEEEWRQLCQKEIIAEEKIYYEEYEECDSPPSSVRNYNCDSLRPVYRPRYYKRRGIRKGWPTHPRRPWLP